MPPQEDYTPGEHILGPASEPAEEEFIDAGPPPEGWRPRHAERDLEVDAAEVEEAPSPPAPSSPAMEPARASAPEPQPAPKAPDPKPEPAPSGPTKRGWWNRLTS